MTLLKDITVLKSLILAKIPFFIVLAAILDTIFFHTNVRLMGISILLQYDTLVTFFDSFKDITVSKKLNYGQKSIFYSFGGHLGCHFSFTLMFG